MIETFVTKDSELRSNIRTFSLAMAASQINGNFTPPLRNITLANGTVTTVASETFTAATKDSLVIILTLAIILFTLVASYYLWKKHRSNVVASNSVYMYSRLSQNDVEVDNISFQGDLTHKSLINVAPVCAEDESCDDDQVRPATLCLQYDSLVTISNADKKESESQKMFSSSVRHNSTREDDTPVNLLIDELSDEQDLLQ